MAGFGCVAKLLYVVVTSLFVGGLVRVKNKHPAKHTTLSVTHTAGARQNVLLVVRITHAYIHALAGVLDSANGGLRPVDTRGRQVYAHCLSALKACISSVSLSEK